MDYKELIEQLKYYGTTYAIGDNLGCEIDGTGQVMMEAASAIETLLAEREAALSKCRGECDECTHADRDADDFPCCDCCHACMDWDKSDRWQWRGPTPPDRERTEG